MDLHFEYIKPGQSDWLKVMNETLAAEDTWHKHFDATMLNGAEGWGTADIWYNKTFFVASFDGWIKIKGNLAIDFMSNPLSSIVNFKNVSAFNRIMTLTAQTSIANGKDGRPLMNIYTDGSGGPICGWYLSQTANADQNATYGLNLHLPFFGSASDLKL